MDNNNRSKSIGLVSIFLVSLFASMVMVPSVSAVNDTTNGVITGTETWTGTMNLDGDVLVSGGAKLIINAGTTINVPANRSLTVEGSICAGDSFCGATQASTNSPVRFVWGAPGDGSDLNQSRCYVQGIFNPDASCGSGIYLDSTIDQSLTRLNHVTLDGAYGIPLAITQSQIKYGAMVFDGASLNVNALTFVNINTTNVLAINGASPTIDSSVFIVGNDGQGYQGAAIQAYGAGAGLVKMEISNSAFTGEETDCGTQGGGRSAVYLENSFVNMDTLSITQNSYGAFLRSSSGSLTNSTINTKCNAIDTNSHLTTNNYNHTFVLSNNAITTAEGAGVTAYDEAIVVAENNQISGASEGSGFGIRSSQVTINNNIIGPIGGWNGIWIYGESDVSAENNTIMNTAKEPLLIGEYHYKDQGWNVPAPTKSRVYFANNIVENNSGTCTSQYMYGGDFLCPAFHVFMSSATFIGNTVSNNAGDGFRIKGGVVYADSNTMEVGQFAANITHYDNNYGDKYGSIAYFSGNTYTNATQVYNVSESRVSVQSELIPSPSIEGGYEYPVMLSWLSADCETTNIDECLQVPTTAVWPPHFMPLAMEVNEAATVFAFADVQNFNRENIHVQNQNQGWNVQVEKGELVRYQVKSDNSQVADADVIVKDATGKPLYNMTTDAYGYTPWITLASDFHIDTSWDHNVTGTNENSCNDRIDNDGDTLTDNQDDDCQNGRELPKYMVTAGKFGKGSSEHEFTLTGMVDEVINLENIAPSVSINQPNGYSFARTITLNGGAHDGLVGPYFNDYDSYLSQYGTITRVEVQPHGSQDWYLATDTSGANGIVNMTNWPFKTWSFDWDMSNHFEEDVTFRVRSFDGVDESIMVSRVFKLNINSPTINLETPLDGSTHSGSSILFSGTAADDYTGVQGSDIQDIWFSVTGPSNYSANYPANSGGGTVWSDTWEFSALPTGYYTFIVWASDSNYCTQTVDSCQSETVTLFVDNDNQRPFVQVESPLPMEVVRASEYSMISGVARDNDGSVTRVEISIWDLAGGYELNSGPDPITSFLPNGYWETEWDTSDLIHDQQYEIYVKSYDGEDYSDEEIIRIKIDNPTNADNIPPVFIPISDDFESWPETIIIFCDENSNNPDRCNDGARIDLRGFFYDLDDPNYNGLQCFPFDDPLTAIDDVHFQRITMSDNYLVANYNPVDWTGTISNDVTEWSLTNVIFTCRDTYDSIAVSYSVNFIVKGVQFSVERVDAGYVEFGNPSEWQGTGLPGSTVFARNVGGQTMINSTVVLADGTWDMQISSAQLSKEGANEIYFVQNDQTIGLEGASSITLNSGEPASGGISTWVWVVIAIVAIVALLGVGAFFFLEFEEEFEEDEETLQTQQKEEDPYAWAKARAAEQAVAAVQAAVPAEQSQHPGWIWDAESNQWVPDPNYQHPPQ